MIFPECVIPEQIEHIRFSCLKRGKHRIDASDNPVALIDFSSLANDREDTTDRHATARFDYLTDKQRRLGPYIVVSLISRNMGLIRFGGRVTYVDLVSSSFVEESLQALGGIRISIRRSLVAAGERPVAI